MSWLRFGPGRIAAGDVDGLFVVERFGWFLFIETKGRTEPLSVGQRILLEALSRVRRFTVLLVRGPKSFPETVQQVRGGYWSEPEATNRTEFQRRVDAWYREANDAKRA